MVLLRNDLTGHGKHEIGAHTKCKLGGTGAPGGTRIREFSDSGVSSLGQSPDEAGGGVKI